MALSLLCQPTVLVVVPHVPDLLKAIFVRDCQFLLALWVSSNLLSFHYAGFLFFPFLLRAGFFLFPFDSWFHVNEFLGI